MRMSKILMASVIAILLGTLCYAKPLKAYSGPEMTADELARVTFSDKMLLKIVLNTIDGKYYWQNNATYPLSYNNGPKIDINILPGYHELEFDVRSDNTSALCTVKVLKHDFQAGTEYILNVDRGVLTVEEKADGKKVVSNPEIVDVPFYKGPEEPESYATLLEDGKAGGLWLMRIDGLPGPNFNFHAFFNDKWNGRFEVKLAPGPHILTYYYKKPGTMPIVKEFAFEAGKRYEFVSGMEMVETDKVLESK